MATTILNTVLTPEAKAENEWVAGIQTSKLFENGYWQGFRRVSETEALHLIEEHLEFRPRTEQLEKDASFKQVILYFLIKNGEKYFVSTRKNKGGDTRAHGFILIGFGGHLRKGDINGRMEDWLKREFEEEVAAEKIESIQFEGLLNDDSEELGGINKVHFGLIFEIETEGQVEIKEKDKFEPGLFMTANEIRMNKQKLETWSKILADFI